MARYSYLPTPPPSPKVPPAGPPPPGPPAPGPPPPPTSTAQQPATNSPGQPAANPLGQPAAVLPGQQAAEPLAQPAAIPLAQPAANPPNQPAANHRHPAGGAVHARVRKVSYAGKFKTCLRCMRAVSVKHWADHAKVHLMEGSFSSRVPSERRCANCTASHRECRVMLFPNNNGCKTLRCGCCIKFKEACSFRALYRGRPIDRILHHPALVDPEDDV